MSSHRADPRSLTSSHRSRHRARPDGTGRAGLTLLALGMGTLMMSAQTAEAAPPRKVTADEGRVAALEAHLARLEAQLAKRPLDPGAYDLPPTLEFCGERVDLRDPQIRERLEMELLLVLGDRAQVALWARRARRVFPVVEAEARAQGGCPDVKYLAVIESGLRPAVTSRASARGWWQFMAATARDFGLATDDAWDERADLEASTRAGVAYLNALREQFGAWDLAMAAYNTGPGRLRRAQEAQGQTDFWKLDLYTEAERYVPRTLAIKAVLSDLSGYGFVRDIEAGWEAEAVGTVKVRVPAGAEIELIDAARGSGVVYRDLRRLNPPLGASRFPAGREIVLRTPRGTESALRAWLQGEIERQARTASAAQRDRSRPKAKGDKASVAGASSVRASGSRRASASRRADARPAAVSAAPARPKRATRAGARSSDGTRHVVKPGESLWSIAQRHQTSVETLRRLNKLGGRSTLQAGQTIVVNR